ncbi:MAG: hypothetical protein V5A28_01195 [Haloarculaceae archaeon]
MASDPGDPDVPPPPVPTDRLTDWERTEATVDRLFGVEGADVRGHTVVYEDRRLREAVRHATGLDRSWRFFFATRLGFRPPLAPGTHVVILPTVRSEAVRSFCRDLEDRGVGDVERGRTERVRTGSGKRVRLRQVTGTVPWPEPVDGGFEDPVRVEGWVGIWYDGDFFVAGGAYPRTSLARALDAGDDRLALSPSAARDELLELVRGVGDE